MQPLAGWWDGGDGILIDPAQMRAVDGETIAAGTPGPMLMEAAGRVVVRAVTERFRPMPVRVLCGPGNNGGDGYVAARLLSAAGWPVRLASLVEPTTLAGDAAWAYGCWEGLTERLDHDFLAGDGLFVDALFGGGLGRDLEGDARAAVDRLNELGAPVIAVDVPSGVDGATGAVRGAAPWARLTVTFCRAKPGHVLRPGRDRVGQLVIGDIGIRDETVCRYDVGLRVNAPARWLSMLPGRHAASHKYSLGHAIVVGGTKWTTGASRLSARAALRVGAGLVSVACTADAQPSYGTDAAALMTRAAEPQPAWRALLDDPRANAFLIGPGAGVGPDTRERVIDILSRAKATVLDADALTTFAADRRTLFSALHSRCALTPHDGEFSRLFDVAGSRLDRARAAAAEAGAVVLLKGADTVVAAPDGRATIQPAAPPWLATAGSGDVLAGLILGLLAQGMEAYEAAAAAAWIHAAAAELLGGPLIADDLPEAVPAILSGLRATRPMQRAS